MRRWTCCNFTATRTPEYCRQFGKPYLKGGPRQRPGVDLLQCAAAFPHRQGLLLDAHVEGMPGRHRGDFRLEPDSRQVAAAGDPVRRAGGGQCDRAAIKQVHPTRWTYRAA